MFGLNKKENIAKKTVKTIIKNNGDNYWSDALKDVAEINELKKKTKDERKQFILHAIDYFVSTCVAPQADDYYAERAITWHIAQKLIRSNLAYTELEWIELFNTLNAAQTELEKKDDHNIVEFPINYAIQQVERYLKKHELSDTLSAFIKDMLTWSWLQPPEHNYFWGTDIKRSVSKLKKIIQDSGEVIAFELKTDDIGTEVMTIIDDLHKRDNQVVYHSIFRLASDVKGSRPTKKFMTTLQSQLAQINKTTYRKAAHQILDVALKHAPARLRYENTYRGETYHYYYHEYLSDPSKNFIKGIVWTLDGFSDNTTIKLLEALLHKSYTKIPDVGPAAAAIGNACIYVLGNMRGKDGLGALSRARLKLKQNNVKKLIQKQLDAGAEKYGVSVAELEEMAVPDFGLCI